MEPITIVQYDTGNLGSIRNMFKALQIPTQVASDPGVILDARKLILAGVGAFDHGMEMIESKGLGRILEEKVLKGATPILGICLGMQLFAEGSDEGKRLGLGWLRAWVPRFRFQDGSTPLKIPHMGWNSVTALRPSLLLKELPPDSRFYFAHSYHLRCDEAGDITGSSRYGYEFPAVIEKGNIFGVQFHPEKSHRFGMKVLENYAKI